MTFRAWLYDLAREQHAIDAILDDRLERSLLAGYNAVGLYLEHRYAYPSAPWVAGPGAMTPEQYRRLEATFRSRGLRIVPFLNTLGHMEGFTRSEGGQWLAEGPPVAGNDQICATRPECADFARGLIDDILDVSDDEWVHIGGDETLQLGQCSQCAERVAKIGPGGLYGEYFGPLCRYVLDLGRRPCLWGDMLLQHPESLDAIPSQTLIFDWQYSHRPIESTRMFRERGFDVVCCPSIQTYNSGWCFLNPTCENIDDHIRDAADARAAGVLVTTWEFSYFTNYMTTMPLIYAAGRRLAGAKDWPEAIKAEGGEAYARAAEILGNQIPAAAEFLRPGKWRVMRNHLVTYQDPFSLWREWRVEACGAAGDAVLQLCDEADTCLETDAPLRFAAGLHRVAVQWVRQVEAAREAYAAGRPADAVAALRSGTAELEALRPGLMQAIDHGGTVGDLGRLDKLISVVEGACARIAELGRGVAGPDSTAAVRSHTDAQDADTPQLATGPAGASPAATHRPAFETIIHPMYTAADQAAWRTGHALKARRAGEG